MTREELIERLLDIHKFDSLSASFAQRRPDELVKRLKGRGVDIGRIRRFATPHARWYAQKMQKKYRFMV